MFRRFHLHQSNPQKHILREISKTLFNGGVIVIPTDSCYALACLTGEKDALERIRTIRGIDDRHHMSLMCRDLSEIALYAKVDNSQFRFLKMATPGAYTFILEGTKELPKRITHAKRKTIGLRIPDHVVVMAILEEINQPLLTCTLMLAGEEESLNDLDEIELKLAKRIDAMIDAGECGNMPTSIIDLTTATPQIIRSGRGDLERLGLI